MSEISSITISTWSLPCTYDAAENTRRIIACIEESARAGADLIVFPECSVQGYPDVREFANSRTALSRMYKSAEVIGGQHSGEITKRAGTLGIHVIFGMTERGDRPGIAYNTAVLAGPNGVLGTYRKVHLGVTERIAWTPGDSWNVYSTPLGNIGMLVCYDLMFPESCRELALGGADILVMPTASGAFTPVSTGTVSESAAVDHYPLLSRARAVENQLWFISANFTGRTGDVLFAGGSQVIDPYGRVLAATSSNAEQSAVTVAVDVRDGIEVVQSRARGPITHRDRRPETYVRIAACQ